MSSDNSQNMNKQDDIKGMKAYVIKQVIITGIVLVVACFAVFAYASTAWFVNAKDSGAQDNTVKVDTPEKSLFIRAAGAEKDYGISVSSSNASELFPISTPDCSNWYYVSGWEQSGLRAFADEYTLAVITDENTGAYSNTFENRNLYAYQKAEFNVYTDGDSGNMGVYLDPVEPISISYTQTGSKDVEAAIRAALVVDGDIAFVYAPKAEEKLGNSGYTSGTVPSDVGYYCIQSGELVSVSGGTPYTLFTNADIADHTAVEDGETPGIYHTKSGSLQICTADSESGTDLTVYVWLEGTDGETIVGTSDAETSPLTVAIKLVGVAD